MIKDNRYIEFSVEIDTHDVQSTLAKKNMYIFIIIKICYQISFNSQHNDLLENSLTLINERYLEMYI